MISTPQECRGVLSTMNVHQFINEQVPAHFRALLPLLFQSGHDLAKAVIQENPVLQLPSMQAGDIRVASIDFVLQRHIQEAAYAGVTASFGNYAKPTGKYFQIETPGAKITINHLKYPSELPRPAEFRRQARRFNHPDLFEDYDKLRRASEERAHLVIIYGDQALEFLFMGALHPELPCWMDSPIDLLRQPHVHPGRADDREGVDASIKMNFKLPTEDLRNQFLKHLDENAAG